MSDALPTPDEFWRLALERHGHTVVLALLAAGVRLDDARDLAQEAWTRLLESHRGGRVSRVELPGLAIRQAMFLLAERRRVLARRVELPQAEAEALPADQAGPEAVIAARQLLSLVSAELEGVSPRGQAVVSAVLEEPAQPHAALAAREGVSLQRFRQILCEVRNRLRSALEGGSR